MRRVEMCWGPECSVTIEQEGRGRTQRYCSTACRQRSVRRNGGKAPSEPYPPYDKALSAPTPPPTVVAPPESPVRLTAGEGADAGSAEIRTERPRLPSMAKPPPAPSAAKPAEPTISVAEHLAKMAELANPPAPEPPPEHPLVAKYRHDLEQVNQAGTREGLQVIELATKLVSTATSPAAAAGLSRELKGLMDSLEQNTPAALAEKDPSLVIRQRTLEKLRAVSAA